MAGAGWMGSWVSASFSGRHETRPPRLSPQTDWQRYGRWLWLAFGLAALGAALIAGSAYVLAGAYSDWAVIVVAGDWHAHDGGPTEIFDNARTDVSRALVAAGFNPSNLVQFSTRPDRYPRAHPLKTEVGNISDTLWDLSNRTKGGCLLYFSSHGTPDGLLVGQTIVHPAKLDTIVSNACGARPTIVVISACYSGAFVDILRGPNRMIMTAARADRSSFGCGGTTKYPYFDECFLGSIDNAHDFRGLAVRTKDCVARMEKQTGMTPPSEPQISIGSEIATHLPAWR
jgi:hypothetical protein